MWETFCFSRPIVTQRRILPMNTMTAAHKRSFYRNIISSCQLFQKAIILIWSAVILKGSCEPINIFFCSNPPKACVSKCWYIMSILWTLCVCSPVDWGINGQIKGMFLLACRAGLQEHLSHRAVPTVTGWTHLSKWLGSICWLSLTRALLKNKQQNSSR